MTTKKRGARSAKTNGLFPGEHADILKDIAAFIPDWERWLDMPNERLSMAKPRDLIGTDREQFVRDMLRALMYGMPT